MLSLEYLAELTRTHHADLKTEVREFSIGGKPFNFNTTPYLMGVVNLSPDSWYQESVCLSTNDAVKRGEQLTAQGAAMVDVGGESSVLNAERVPASEQIARLVPVISGLVQSGVLVSAETYEPPVAEACLKAGAGVVNLTGPGEANEIYQLCAKHEAAVIICFVQGQNVREVNDVDLEVDAIPRMVEFFAGEIDRAQLAGVRKIIIDPGLGFYYQNLDDSTVRVRRQMEVFLNTFRMRQLGWPVCHALPHAAEIFKDEVRCAEPFFALLAALGKTSLFRTHEVPRTRAVLETLNIY
ncbi:MAG: dihydropteroate synthase [Verrucomicrobia subdivision 3 bacterium]|nr:dihydropteroate synthase [Limisphaerales bacterium]